MLRGRSLRGLPDLLTTLRHHYGRWLEMNIQGSSCFGAISVVHAMSYKCAEEQVCKSSPRHGGWSMVANPRQPCPFGRGIPLPRQSQKHAITGQDPLPAEFDSLTPRVPECRPLESLKGSPRGVNEIVAKPCQHCLAWTGNACQLRGAQAGLTGVRCASAWESFATERQRLPPAWARISLHVIRLVRIGWWILLPWTARCKHELMFLDPALRGRMNLRATATSPVRPARSRA